MVSRWRSITTITTTIITTTTWCRVRYAACCVGIIITTTTIITTTIERHGAGSGIEAGSGDGPRLRLGLPLAGLRGAQQVAIGAVEHRIGIRRPR